MSGDLDKIHDVVSKATGFWFTSLERLIILGLLYFFAGLVGDKLPFIELVANVSFFLFFLHFIITPTKAVMTVLLQSRRFRGYTKHNERSLAIIIAGVYFTLGLILSFLTWFFIALFKMQYISPFAK